MSYWVGKPLVSLVVRVHSIMGKWNLRVFETTDGPLKKKKKSTTLTAEVEYTNTHIRLAVAGCYNLHMIFTLRYPGRGRGETTEVRYCMSLADNDTEGDDT